MGITNSVDGREPQYRILKAGFGNPKVAPLVERLVRSREELKVLDVGSGLPRTHLPQIERFLAELAGKKDVWLIGTDATRFPNPAHQEGDKIVPSVTTMIVGDADFAEITGRLRLEAQTGIRRFDIITSLNYFPDPLMPGVYAHRHHPGAVSAVFERLRPWLAGDGILFVSTSEADDLPRRVITEAGFYVVLEMPDGRENADAGMDPGSHLIVATRAE